LVDVRAQLLEARAGREGEARKLAELEAFYRQQLVRLSD
jgi:hypothetical protein